MKMVFCYHANKSHFQKQDNNIEDFSSTALAPKNGRKIILLVNHVVSLIFAWSSEDFSELSGV